MRDRVIAARELQSAVVEIGPWGTGSMAPIEQSNGPIRHFSHCVEPLAFIAANPPENFGLGHVSDGLFLAVPFLDLHRPWDRVGLGELGL